MTTNDEQDIDRDHAGTAIVAQAKEDEELSRLSRRKHLKALNLNPSAEVQPKTLDSSLKRHTALIKRIRQSVGSDNCDQISKDIAQLSLEKYLDEIASAVLEGIGKCKTERDVRSAVEVISLLHRRFPTSFTPSLIAQFANSLAPPQRTQSNAQPVGQPSTGTSSAPALADQKDKDDASRVARQRPVLRVCSELALVGIIKDGPDRSGAEWIMKTIKELLSNDPSLSSLPLLSTFLKSYAKPFLGISPPSQTKTQISENLEPGTLALSTQDENRISAANSENEADELVEKDIRVRFKRMCEGYFESVSKKLHIEHKRLQDQDRRNHEAYIRSGEIFEDRQQAYEKMTKAYEKLLTSCQTLSDLLYLSMPDLPTQTHKVDSIIVTSSENREVQDDFNVAGSKWEDEEERRFFEDIQDLQDFVPKGLLGIDETDAAERNDNDAEKERKNRAEEEIVELENELKKLELLGDKESSESGTSKNDIGGELDNEDDTATPVPSPPKTPTRPESPGPAPQAQGPSQLLTALLARLPDATNRVMIDSAAVEFANLNSKAARKRLVKFLTQVPKNRIDLLPHYSRLAATLAKYMPDIGSELVTFLDEEFRYLQRKKNVKKELAEVRRKNITYISNLTKFNVVPTHIILHIFKVCLDDFSGVNIENLAMLLEGCGRFLLRSEETMDRFAVMLQLLRRKQSLHHLDERQTLLLENAYYQCNPPDRAPRVEKERSPMEQFIRHIIYDVLAKKTIDKVLKLLRKLDWNDPDVYRVLFRVFTKPWKLKFGNVSLLAMLAYDLQRYHADFSLAIVDQVLEDIRFGLETNAYKANQQRVATIKYLGELYIYRLISSSIVFDTFWSLATFGHPDGRPLPGQICPIDSPDDFFRVRLICVLLDTCGMCFEKGSQRKKLDSFLTFFQLYIFTKDQIPMDVEFMLDDSLEACRPKFERFKSFEEAVAAVDDMFSSLLQVEASEDDQEDSGDESEAEEEEAERGVSDEEEDDDHEELESPIDGRPASPDTLVVLNSSEHLGPTEEDEADFEKELAKLVTETGTGVRKVDKRNIQSLRDAAVVPTALKKKRTDGSDEDGDNEDGDDASGESTMKFMLITKKGNKQQTRKIAIPTSSALATQTLTAQMQDKAQQEQLKRLVLNYEQREEAEELKAIEARSRNGAIKIRYAG